MDKIKLRDGRIATIGFLSEKDGVRELQRFINGLVKESTYLLYDRRMTLKEEKEWKRKNLAAFRKRDGYALVARVDGKLAGTSNAHREKFKARDNITLAIAIAKRYRGIGLGEALLRLNIKTAKRFFRPKPRSIYLSVFGPNKAARSLYRKLGFREFAVFPGWFLHRGKYEDQVFMKL